MSAWREPRGKIAAPIAFAVYVALILGLVGIILWKLWTEVLAGMAL